MKLIVDKNQLGLETTEFREYLKTPCPKTNITQTESDELRIQLTEALTSRFRNICHTNRY